MEKDRQLVSPTLPNASIASDSTFASSVPRSPRSRALGTTEPWSPKSPSHVELSVADFLVTPRDSFSPSSQRTSGTRFTFTPKSRAPGAPGTPGQPHAHEGQPRPDSPASKDDDQLFELLSPLQITSRNLLPRKKQPNEEPTSPPSPLPTATLLEAKGAGHPSAPGSPSASSPSTLPVPPQQDSSNVLRDFDLPSPQSLSLDDRKALAAAVACVLDASCSRLLLPERCSSVSVHLRQPSVTNPAQAATKEEWHVQENRTFEHIYFTSLVQHLGLGDLAGGYLNLLEHYVDPSPFLLPLESRSLQKKMDLLRLLLNFSCLHIGVYDARTRKVIRRLCNQLKITWAMFLKEENQLAVNLMRAGATQATLSRAATGLAFALSAGTVGIGPDGFYVPSFASNKILGPSLGLVSYRPVPSNYGLDQFCFVRMHRGVTKLIKQKRLQVEQEAKEKSEGRKAGSDAESKKNMGSDQSPNPKLRKSVHQDTPPTQAEPKARSFSRTLTKLLLLRPPQDTTRKKGIDDHDLPARALQVVLAVNGWISTDEEFVRPWKSLYKSLAPTSECYSLVWDSGLLNEFAAGLKLASKKEIKDQFKGQMLPATVLSTLMANVTWPAALLKVSSSIERPWTALLEQSKKAGVALADTIESRAQGGRPITLIGYSVGALVIFEALEEIARRRNARAAEIRTAEIESCELFDELIERQEAQEREIERRQEVELAMAKRINKQKEDALAESQQSADKEPEKDGGLSATLRNVRGSLRNLFRQSSKSSITQDDDDDEREAIASVSGTSAPPDPPSEQASSPSLSTSRSLSGPVPSLATEPEFSVNESPSVSAVSSRYDAPSPASLPIPPSMLPFSPTWAPAPNKPLRCASFSFAGEPTGTDRYNKRSSAPTIAQAQPLPQRAAPSSPPTSTASVSPSSPSISFVSAPLETIPEPSSSPSAADHHGSSGELSTNPLPTPLSASSALSFEGSPPRAPSSTRRSSRRLDLSSSGSEFSSSPASPPSVHRSSFISPSAKRSSNEPSSQESVSELKSHSFSRGNSGRRLLPRGDSARSLHSRNSSQADGSRSLSDGLPPRSAGTHSKRSSESCFWAEQARAERLWNEDLDDEGEEVTPETRSSRAPSHISRHGSKSSLNWPTRRSDSSSSLLPPFHMSNQPSMDSASLASSQRELEGQSTSCHLASSCPTALFVSQKGSALLSPDPSTPLSSTSPQAFSPPRRSASPPAGRSTAAGVGGVVGGPERGRQLAHFAPRSAIMDVYLFGAPISADARAWERVRSMASGRMVNGFSTSDWLLSFLQRSADCHATAGLGLTHTIDGVENIDLTSLVSGHEQYASKMESVLRFINFQS